MKRTPFHPSIELRAYCLLLLTRLPASSPPQLPAGCTLMGDAIVHEGQLRLGGASTVGSVLLEPDSPPDAFPPVESFEASWQIWAPCPPSNLSTVVQHTAGNASVSPPAGQPHTRHVISANHNGSGEQVGTGAAGAAGAGVVFSGYSISFGDLHAAAPTGAGQQPFGRFGAGRGLRVVFSLSTAQLVPVVLGRCDAPFLNLSCQQHLIRSDTIEVMYDQQTVARASVGRNLSSSSWEQVSVQVAAGRVSVTHGGVLYLSEVQLPTWQPQSRWVFGIGASAGADSQKVSFDDWRLSSAWLHAAHSAPVRLSFSAQQLTAPLYFGYYLPPTVSSITPSHGPTEGATLLELNGLFLSAGSRPIVRLNGSIDILANVSSPQLLLASTAASTTPSTGQAFLSFNGQQYHAMRPKFNFVSSPEVVSSVLPASAPQHGGTLITVHGQIAAVRSLERRCRFASIVGTSSATAEGTVVGGALRCVSPAWPSESSCTIQVSFNGQQFSSKNASVSFAFFQPPVIELPIPASSTSTGGARVELRGRLPERTQHPLYCRFGDQVVVAANLSCVAPPDQTVGAGADLGGDSLILHGAARRGLGVVQLTDRLRAARADLGGGDVGYALTPLLTPHGVFASFRAEFELLLDPAGFGASFNYGDLPADAAALAEGGGGGYLRLLFLTAARRELRVLYDSERLVTCTLPSRPSGNAEGAWHSVLVQYISPLDADHLGEQMTSQHSGLLVVADGSTCVSNRMLLRWGAGGGWRAGFGARSGSVPARHWLRAFRLQAGARASRVAIPLAVSANLQQWSSSVPFVYMSAPRTSAMTPTTGPSAGGSVITLLGAHLHGTQHACRFDGANPSDVAHVTTATYRPTDGSVACRAPSRAELTGTPWVSSVRFSSNGQQYSSDAHPFTFFDTRVRVAHRLTPASGPASGGSALRLPLIGLNESAVASVRAEGLTRCALNGTIVVASISADGLEVRCMSPPIPEVGDVEIRISLNGQDLLELAIDTNASSLAYGSGSPHLFHLFNQPEPVQLAPSKGPPAGNTPIALRLSPAVPLLAGSNVTCRFGSATVIGVLLPSTLHARMYALRFPPRRLVAIPSVGGLGFSAAFWAGKLVANSSLPAHMHAGVQVDGDPMDATKQQWFHSGKGTCVGYGTPGASCEAAQFVCTSSDGLSHGSAEQQVLAFVDAVLAGGGVHPSCPSLFAFDAAAVTGASAWPHSGANDWHHSTVVRRGSSAGDPVVAADSWRAYLRAELSEEVSCISPNATAAAAAWQAALDFDCVSSTECATLAAATGLRTAGAAILYGGLLRLTHASAPYLSESTYGSENVLQPVLPGGGDPARGETRFGSGSAVVDIPPGAHAAFIHLDFELVIGGGTGGEGFSVSFGGELPLGYIGAQGAGLGLRVLFLTHHSWPRVEVLHNGDLLGSTRCESLRSNELTHVAITAKHAGLTVQYGGVALFKDLPLPAWAPQRGWQLAFAAASGAGTDNHWLDNLHISTGAHVDRTPIPVTLSLNGQQFTSEVAYTYTETVDQGLAAAG